MHADERHVIHLVQRAGLYVESAVDRFDHLLRRPLLAELLELAPIELAGAASIRTDGLRGEGLLEAVGVDEQPIVNRQLRSMISG